MQINKRTKSASVKMESTYIKKESTFLDKYNQLRGD